tara:strand:+ start:117 stop:692 length:576 start_codon:yes stop_codon:yes gene_type:complete
MNIFVLSDNPSVAAEMMLDKHVVKMPTESLQMISTIVDMHGYGVPFTPVMKNHPCTIWARESSKNFQWLVDHAHALCKEYTLRYNKKHKVQTLLEDYEYEIEQVGYELKKIKDVLTPFAIAIGPDMLCRKHPDFESADTVDKYRLYYLEDKWRFACWELGSPKWWPNDHIHKKTQEWNEWLESENKRIRGY